MPRHRLLRRDLTSRKIFWRLNQWSCQRIEVYCRWRKMIIVFGSVKKNKIKSFQLKKSIEMNWNYYFCAFGRKFKASEKKKLRKLWSTVVAVVVVDEAMKERWSPLHNTSGCRRLSIAASVHENRITEWNNIEWMGNVNIFKALLFFIFEVIHPWTTIILTVHHR